MLRNGKRVRHLRSAIPQRQQCHCIDFAGREPPHVVRLPFFCKFQRFSIEEMRHQYEISAKRFDKCLPCDVIAAVVDRKQRELPAWPSQRDRIALIADAMFLRVLQEGLYCFARPIQLFPVHSVKSLKTTQNNRINTMIIPVSIPFIPGIRISREPVLIPGPINPMICHVVNLQLVPQLDCYAGQLVKRAGAFQIP